MVLPNDAVFAFVESPLLNNGVTRWRRFPKFWTFFRMFVEPACASRTFFECSHAKSGTGLHIDEHRFFLVLTSTVLPHSALFCAVRFGATLHGWWKCVFTRAWCNPRFVKHFKIVIKNNFCLIICFHMFCSSFSIIKK